MSRVFPNIVSFVMAFTLFMSAYAYAYAHGEDSCPQSSSSSSSGEGDVHAADHSFLEPVDWGDASEWAEEMFEPEENGDDSSRIMIESNEGEKVGFPSYFEVISPVVEANNIRFKGTRSMALKSMDIEDLRFFYQLVKKLPKAARDQNKKVVQAKDIDAKTSFDPLVVQTEIGPILVGSSDDRLTRLCMVTDYLLLDALMDPLCGELIDREYRYHLSRQIDSDQIFIDMLNQINIVFPDGVGGSELHIGVPLGKNPFGELRKRLIELGDSDELRGVFRSRLHSSVKRKFVRNFSEPKNGEFAWRRILSEQLNQLQIENKKSTDTKNHGRFTFCSIL